MISGFSFFGKIHPPESKMSIPWKKVDSRKKTAAGSSYSTNRLFKNILLFIATFLNNPVAHNDPAKTRNTVSDSNHHFEKSTGRMSTGSPWRLIGSYGEQ